jgi:hypothetical protein
MPRASTRVSSLRGPRRPASRFAAVAASRFVAVAASRLASAAALLVRLAPPAAALLAGACATSLSTFQPAHVPRPGGFQAAAGQDVSIPTGTIRRAIDAGQALERAARERALGPEEQLDLLEAGMQIALDPPALVSHASLAYAPVTNLELGLRYTSGAWRLGGRYQLWRQDRHGLDLSAGLGLQRFAYDFPLQDLLDYVRIDGFERWNLDLPLLLGKQSAHHRLWGGAKLLLSSFDAGLSQDLPSGAGGDPQRVVARASGRALTVALQGGAAVGFRHVFLGVELTLARVFAEASLEVQDARRTADLGGFVVYPGLALMGEW